MVPSAALGLTVLLSGCFWLGAVVEDAPGPDGVDPELRLPLRLSVVGLHASTLLLYGGADHDVFLGCYTCDREDPHAVFNADGLYGSTRNAHSIWNPHCPFGDRKSPYSPWNPHATAPPLIKDEYDVKHGDFTANPDFPGRTTDPATVRFLKYESEASWLNP